MLSQGDGSVPGRGGEDDVTVPLALNSLVDSESRQGVGLLFAMSLLSLVPILIVFTVAQKYLIQGIATTGLK